MKNFFNKISKREKIAFGIIVGVQVLLQGLLSTTIGGVIGTGIYTAILLLVLRKWGFDENKQIDWFGAAKATATMTGVQALLASFFVYVDVLPDIPTATFTDVINIVGLRLFIYIAIKNSFYGAFYLWFCREKPEIIEAEVVG